MSGLRILGLLRLFFFLPIFAVLVHTLTCLSLLFFGRTLQTELQSPEHSKGKGFKAKHSLSSYVGRKDCCYDEEE